MPYSKALLQYRLFAKVICSLIYLTNQFIYVIETKNLRFNWENILLFILGEFWNVNFLLKYLHFLWKLLAIWEFPAGGDTDNSDWEIEIEDKCPKGF